MRTETYHAEVSIELSEAEVLSHARRLGGLMQTRESLDSQLDRLKGSKKEVDAQIDEIHTALRSRRTMRTVEVFERLDQNAGMVEVVASHSGEVVHTRAAVEHDYQRELREFDNGAERDGDDEVGDAPVPADPPVEGEDAGATEPGPTDSGDDTPEPSVEDAIENELEEFLKKGDAPDAEDAEAAEAVAAELDEQEPAK